jgi:hypothetical protein
VASIAAGSGSYQSPDTSGVAPNADIYDVRVLDERGIGNVADVIAGIDWVIQNASAKGIRVMNLSLAAGSTESYVTDPLARAARAADRRRYRRRGGRRQRGQDGGRPRGVRRRRIPGARSLGHHRRRGQLHAHPARRRRHRCRIQLAGPDARTHHARRRQRVVDNLLKPDLVAPGQSRGRRAFVGRARHARGWNLLATTYPQLAAVPAPRRPRTRR